MEVSSIWFYMSGLSTHTSSHNADDMTRCVLRMYKQNKGGTASTRSTRTVFEERHAELRGLLERRLLGDHALVVGRVVEGLLETRMRGTHTDHIV